MAYLISLFFQFQIQICYIGMLTAGPHCIALPCYYNSECKIEEPHLMVSILKGKQIVKEFICQMHSVTRGHSEQ